MSTHLSNSGIVMRLTSSAAATAVVTATAAGTSLARGSVAFFAKGVLVRSRTLRIPLTRAGRAMLRRRCVRVSVTVNAADLAGSHTAARSAATLAR